MSAWPSLSLHCAAKSIITRAVGDESGFNSAPFLFWGSRLSNNRFPSNLRYPIKPALNLLTRLSSGGSSEQNLNTNLVCRS